jgi:hypothetical protein
MSERRDSVSAAEEPTGAPVLPALGVAPSRRRRRRTSPHSHKFLAATAALVGFAIGALAVAIVLIVSSGPRAGSGPKWSSWSPNDGGLAGEREIAAAVSPFYRASPASQLVIVTVHNVNSNSTSSGSSQTSQIALRDPNTGSLGELSGTTALYNLCGLGPGCAIATGTPSQARLLLLRREALELALYTFKYIGGVDNVVAVLPPGRVGTSGSLTPAPQSAKSSASATSTIDMAVLFQRQSLQHYLQAPLRLTLPETLPPTVNEMTNAPEAELVSVLTSQTLFQQSTVQTQDGSSVMVLNPLPPQ